MVWKKTKNILMNQHSLINFCLEKGLFFTFVASYHVGFESLNPGTLAHFLKWYYDENFKFFFPVFFSELQCLRPKKDKFVKFGSEYTILVKK